MGTIEVGELLYEYRANVTGIAEYGVSFEALIGGSVAPPAEGARFDVSFAGPAKGSRLNGRVTGVDYLRVRADGRFDLHIHAEIVADDGDRISLHADGIAALRPNTSLADLRENVTLFSSSRNYTWLNPLQVWATGTVDLAEQVIHIKGHAA